MSQYDYTITFFGSISNITIITPNTIIKIVHNWIEFLLVVFTPDSNKYRRKINDTLWLERGSILYDMLIKCLSEYKNKLKIFGGNN